MQVEGMCWWGDSRLIVSSRLKHGYILLVYSRKHLDSRSLLLSPIRLPVGMRPLFMQVAHCPMQIHDAKPEIADDTEQIAFAIALIFEASRLDGFSDALQAGVERCSRNIGAAIVLCKP